MSKLNVDQKTVKELFENKKADFLPIMLTKSEVWAYEHEWRIIFSGSEHGLHESPKIKAVYLGAKMEDASR